MNTITFQISGLQGDGAKDEFEIDATQALNQTYVDSVVDAYHAAFDVGVDKISTSQDVALAGMLATPESGVSHSITGSLTVLKTNLRPHTFDLFPPKNALINGESLITSNAAFPAFTAAFGLATKWYVSRGESLKAAPNIVAGKLNQRNKKHQKMSVPPTA